MTTTTSNRRISSLEAAGVRSSSSSGTPSSSSTSKKRALINASAPISTTRAVRSSKNVTPSTSPIVSKRSTITSTRKHTTPNSINTPSATPLTKKRRGSALTNILPASPPSARSASVNSSHTTSATSPRASTPNSSSTTLTSKIKLVSLQQISRRLSITTETIEELKDKNDKMQQALSENQNLLKEREENLKELVMKLEQLEHEMKHQKLLMQQQKAENKHNMTLIEATAEKESIVQQELPDKDLQAQALIEKIELLQYQSNEIKQSFSQERIALIQHYEAAEEKNRENMDKLRQKLENENEVLNNEVLNKERDIKRLTKDMDEMRDNIREMHQCHQTRLTTLTNQLQHQHTDQMDQLKSDYETRLNLRHENEDNDNNKKEFMAELGNKIKELELLKSNFSDYILQAQTEKEELNQLLLEKIESFEKDHHTKIEKLKNNTAEIEATYKAEVNSYKIKLQGANEEIQRIEERNSKERTGEMQMNLQQEEHQNMLIELKEAHENEKKDIDRFEKEHEIQLKAEVVAVDEIINDYQLKLNETGQVKNELLKALQNQQSETKHILEAEKKRYNDLMTKYDDLNAAAAANVNHAELKICDTEKANVNRIETEPNLIINKLKAEHEILVDNLKLTHAKELDLAKQHAEESLTQAYENEIQKLKLNEQLLRDELLTSKEQIQISQLEFGQAEKFKSAELKMIETRDKAQKEYNAELESRRLFYVAHIDELKDKMSKLEFEIKICYSQSMQESIYGEVIHADEMSNLKYELETARITLKEQENRLKECTYELETKVNDEFTQLKLPVIIEQHQKELNILQNQFQSLLDMKDKELNNLVYQIKSRNGSLPIAASLGENNVEQEQQKRLHKLEENLKSKSLEMRWLESDSEQNETKVKEQSILIQNVKCNSKLDGSIQQFKDKNEQMLRRVFN